MNAEERARFTMQALIARGLGATGVAQVAGLARASEVWGGDEPLDRAAWYLWLAGSPGAYKLELEEGEVLPAGQWRARFTIRYYPSPEEPAFAGLSAEERAVVHGGLLDDTGTPRIETASGIPGHLFVVGSLEWASDPGGETTVIGLAALDRLVARDEAGEVLRDVPGWRPSATLLTTLAGLHAKIERRTLRRVVLNRQEGFEFVAAGSESRWRDTKERVQGQAGLLFVTPGRPPSGADALLEAGMEAGAEVVADERFEGTCRHPQSMEADPRIPLPVSHAWFGGEVIPEDRIACAC